MAAKESKILVGSCVKQDLKVLEYHLRSISNLKTPSNTTLEYVFVDDSDDLGTAELIYDILPGAQILSTDPRPDDSLYVVGRDTHEWNAETFDHLAKQKQKLLDYTVANDFSHCYLIDSDLILERRSLLSALSLSKPLVSNIFWTEWQRGRRESLGPNVWLRNPYVQEGMGYTKNQFWKRLIDRRETRIYGGGACHLVHRSALEKGVRYYPRLAGLPDDGMWQGEDRTFAITAFQLHIQQVADPWPDIFHAYHPDQRTEDILEAALEGLSGPSQKYAKYGDLINVCIEPLEESQLSGNVYSIRGRLGGLDMIPNLENLLLSISVGGEPIIHELVFPFWWPEMGGQKRIVRLSFIDTKPYTYHPTLDTYALETL